MNKQAIQSKKLEESKMTLAQKQQDKQRPPSVAPVGATIATISNSPSIQNFNAPPPSYIEATGSQTVVPPGLPKPETVAPPGLPKPETVAPPGLPKPETVAPPGLPKPETVAPPGSPKPETVVVPESPKPETVTPTESPKPETVVAPESPQSDLVPEIKTNRQGFKIAKRIRKAGVSAAKSGAKLAASKASKSPFVKAQTNKIRGLAKQGKNRFETLKRSTSLKSLKNAASGFKNQAKSAVSSTVAKGLSKTDKFRKRTASM